MKCFVQPQRLQSVERLTTFSPVPEELTLVQPLGLVCSLLEQFFSGVIRVRGLKQNTYIYYVHTQLGYLMPGNGKYSYYLPEILRFQAGSESYSSLCVCSKRINFVALVGADWPLLKSCKMILIIFRQQFGGEAK